MEPRPRKESLCRFRGISGADEPTGALDWAHGEQVIELLRDAAHERGATILVVAHDARMIPFADRVCHLEDGRFRESEQPVNAMGGVSSRRAGSYRGTWNGQPLSVAAAAAILRTNAALGPLSASS